MVVKRERLKILFLITLSNHTKTLFKLHENPFLVHENPFLVHENPFLVHENPFLDEKKRS